MNSDKLWIMNYGSSLREKEEHLDNLCCESSQPTVESKAHEIRTTLKRRWIFKRASGNRCLHDAGETRPPRKAEAAAAIPCQYIREQSQSTEKERILREGKIRTTIPGWQTCRKHSLKILIFKYVYFDTMVDFTMKKREHSSVRMLVSLPKTAEASNLEIGRYSCNPKTMSGLSHQEWWITQRFFTRVQFIYSVDRARDH